MAGFLGRRREHDDRVPPGQYVTHDFPVLTAGPTEVVPTDRWQLTVSDGTTSATFDWAGLHALGLQTLTTDIHCVTHWSKLGTTWRGVPIPTLLEAAGVDDLPYALVTSYGGYTTNVPLEDLVDRDAMVAVEFEGEPLRAEHGGPGPAARAPPLPVEEREVGHPDRAARLRPPRLLGGRGLPQPRRPVPRAALPR